MTFHRSLLALAMMSVLGRTYAAEAPATPDSADANTLNTVSVIGQGETRQVQRINPADTQIQIGRASCRERV